MVGVTGRTTEATRGAGGGSARRPGRLPRSVYVRRRIVALLLLVLVLTAVVAGIKALVGAIGGALAGAQAAAPVEEESSPGQPGPCTRADVDAELDAPAEAVAGSAVSFALAVENTGDAACLLDVGAGAVDVAVVSGEDEVWSSATCPSGPAERELLLAPGDSTEVAVEWSGRRAVPGCAGPAAGAGTYRVEAGIGGADAGEAVFVLR